MTHVIAHRGASARFPENSLAAFAGAVSMGADGIELDVRRTADGAPAIHHDAELADGRLICEIAARDLPAEVVMLPEALTACGGAMVNIEIKNVKQDADFDPDQSMATVVVDLVRALGVADQIVVSSFGFAAIDRVHELEPALRTAWLVSNYGDPLVLIDRAAAGGHQGIHPHWAIVDEAFVEHAHSLGLFVNTWTVDDPDLIRRFGDIGVDGVVTNVPDVALAALGRG